MELRFRERKQVREFVAANGVAKLEEELDTGSMDLRSTILVEQYLDDEPMRARARRRKLLARLWNFVAIGVCLAAAVGVAFLLWLMVR
ncbi:MAG: hypothetical protein EON93_06455 [Burkholderiales bacterium]|nr:MAG: hypothetical protein EON93_06455 [Burkholderiales bacterium]